MIRAISLFSCLALSAALFAADAKPAADAKNVLKPTAEVKNWRLEQHEEAKAAISAADGAIVFDVTKDDGTDWHVQAFQTPVELKDNTEYVVTFKAKSDVERAVRVQAGIDQEDWHLVGLDEEVTLGKEWKEYEAKFTATETVAMKNRVGFVLGMAKGKVYVKDLVVKPAK
ncbi:carbohydrate binding domain-containing protein [Humisphaera borealis]|uniref:Carbohydrate binding domain-containing protein n=1 Tax=Humisphaera borealis TaxID=2807512 RepID=A0A7M2X480_9BACT|nr:carbohydrate binding domain-containing protein [Humisphaera borealis]QOV91570.1 carbohydrate binding domain-containing protein [Humisphaera borealis]